MPSDLTDSAKIPMPVAWLLLGVIVVSAFGCAVYERRVELPSADQFEREQLRIFSDLRLPRRHRLLDELTARRRDIADRLLLPMSDEPINVYLFDDQKRFAKYLSENHPGFPDRRAFFVKNDTNLRVFAYWGDHVGEDLRHEVTHGYLHSVVGNLPLWLDEGLAEYFELARGQNGFHSQHIIFLTSQARTDDWRPSLERLEQLDNASQMTQLDYAESWLWVHYLLETRPELRSLLQDQLARLRMTGDGGLLSDHLQSVSGNADEQLIDHLAMLGAKIKGQQQGSPSQN